MCLSGCVDVSAFVSLSSTHPDMCMCLSGFVDVSVFLMVCGCACVCQGVWM